MNLSNGLINIQEEKVSRKEYVKVIQERNKYIKILQKIDNILNAVDLYGVKDINFNKILCRECICKVCFNKECSGNLCDNEGFKCDWEGGKDPVFECRYFE
jgi:hypothetical protein